LAVLPGLHGCEPPSTLKSNQLVAMGIGHRFQARMNAKLCHQALNVIPDRGLAEMQVRCHRFQIDALTK
jgi:hypothetical protein